MLATAAVLGAVLLVVVRAPERQLPREAIRGQRVFRVGTHGVEQIVVTLEGRRFAARRTGSTWAIDGHPANAGTADALDDLVDTLVRLRAVDVFRPADGASFGLDAPQATIELVGPHATRRLLLGAPNSIGSAFYAQRPGDPRVLQVGAGILSELERVFYHRDREAGDGAAQPPEMG